MQRHSLSVAILLGLTVGAAYGKETPFHWLRRIDEALPIARAQDKDVLINFTGHGSCGKCELLDRRVFRQAEFAAATVDFVLVEIDFPSGEDIHGSDLHDEYEEWKRHYLIQGWPTVVLADSTGRPFAYTGYDEGITAKSFLAQLKSAKEARQSRDRELAMAVKASSKERAIRLDAALQALGDQMGTLDDLHDDPLLVFYGDIVQEIRALDPDNSLGLRERYDARAAARTDWMKREAVFDELEKLSSAKNYSAAVSLIRETLPTIQNVEILWRLENARQVYLEWDAKYEQALSNARRLMAEVSTTSKNYDWLLDREAFNLFNLGRIEEGLGSYDRRIANAVDHSTERLSLIDWKAQMLLGHSTPDQAISALRDYRDAAAPGSDDWENAAGLLSLMLTEQGEHREALAINQALLTHYLKFDETRAAAALLAMARSQHALGMAGEAKHSLDRAKKMLPETAETHNEKQGLESLRKQLFELSMEIESPKPVK